MANSRYNFGRDITKTNQTQPTPSKNKFGHTVLGQSGAEVVDESRMEINADPNTGLHCRVSIDDSLPKILLAMLDSEELRNLTDDDFRRKQILDQLNVLGVEIQPKEDNEKPDKETRQRKTVNISDIVDNEYLINNINRISDELEYEQEEEISNDEEELNEPITIITKKVSPDESENSIKKCIKCNAAILETAKFCSECGAKQGSKFCVECGFKFVGTEKFCPECGKNR